MKSDWFHRLIPFMVGAILAVATGSFAIYLTERGNRGARLEERTQETLERVLNETRPEDVLKELKEFRAEWQLDRDARISPAP